MSNKTIPKNKKSFIITTLTIQCCISMLRAQDRFLSRKEIAELHTGPQRVSDDPQVIDLEIRFTRLELKQHNLSFEKKKVDFDKEINDICLEETPKPTSCLDSQKNIADMQKDLEKQINSTSDKINQTTKDINSLLTDEQKTKRDNIVAKRASKRNKELRSAMSEYLGVYQQKEVNERTKYNNFIDFYQLHEIDQSIKYLLQKHLAEHIANYQNLVNRMTKNIKLIEKTWLEYFDI